MLNVYTTGKTWINTNLSFSHFASINSQHLLSWCSHLGSSLGILLPRTTLFKIKGIGLSSRECKVFEVELKMDNNQKLWCWKYRNSTTQHQQWNSKIKKFANLVMYLLSFELLNLIVLLFVVLLLSPFSRLLVTCVRVIAASTGSDKVAFKLGVVDVDVYLVSLITIWLALL